MELHFTDIDGLLIRVDAIESIKSGDGGKVTFINTTGGHQHRVAIPKDEVVDMLIAAVAEVDKRTRIPMFTQE